MNRLYLHILRSITTLAFCAVVASCSKDDIRPGQGEPLPPGKYPLELTASVEGISSRAASKDEWNKGDQIAVVIGNVIDNLTELGKYQLDSYGTVMGAEKPLAWRTTEKTTVRAWFPSLNLNEVKTVEIDDQNFENGLKEIDFLTAVSHDQSYEHPVNLEFKHNMAKISCIVRPGDGISAKEFKTLDLHLEGYTVASFREGVLTGSYKDGNKENKWVTPYCDKDGDDLKEYSALMVPLAPYESTVIRINLTVNVNGIDISKTLTYTDNIAAGVHNRYDITVQKDRLVVNPISANWDNVGSIEEHPADAAVFKVLLNEDIPETTSFEGIFVKKDGTDFEGKFVGKDELFFKKDGDQTYIDVRGNSFTMSYTQKNSEEMVECSIENDKDTPGRNTIVEKTETNSKLTTFTWTINLRSEVVNLTCEIVKVAVGDYYYSDGTTSKVLQETETRKCIGIVFKVGAGGDDTYADKATNYLDENGNQIFDKIQGYVVALEDASESTVIWCNNTKIGNVACPNMTFGLSNVGTAANALKTFNGFTYFSTIIKHTDYNKGPENFFAVNAVENYSKPEIVYNGVTGVKAPETSSGWYLPSQGQLLALSSAKDKLATIPEAIFTPLASEGYWSITFNKGSAYYYDVISGSNGSKNKSTNFYHVRAVLTF